MKVTQVVDLKVDFKMCNQSSCDLFVLGHKNWMINRNKSFFHNTLITSGILSSQSYISMSDKSAFNSKQTVLSKDKISKFLFVIMTKKLRTLYKIRNTLEKKIVVTQIQFLNRENNRRTTGIQINNMPIIGS